MRAPWILALLIVPACSKAPAPIAAVATPPPPQIVYVVATPTAAPAVAAPPAVQHAEQSFAVPPPPPPTVNVAEIPNMDRPREPDVAPSTVRDQMVRCLVYSVETDSSALAVSGLKFIGVLVTARNRCHDVSFAPNDCWFEVLSRPERARGNQIVSREVGRFQDAIPPDGSATTRITLAGDPMTTYRFEASPWWAAGGGRKIGE